MATYDLGKVVGDAGEKGDDGSSVWNTSTAPTYANSKYTFTISNLSGKTGLEIAVNDIIFYSTYYYIVSAVNTSTVDCSTRVSIKGSDASVTIVDNLNSTSSTSALSAKQGKVLNDNKIETSAIVTSFGSTPSDSKVASEKLVKNSLDGKQATLVSGTNIKTINNNSLLGSGNIDIQGSSVDIVTSWEQTPSDSKVASEKLTKDTLDTKANASSLSAVATSGDYDDLSNKPTIPSKISDLQNDSDFIETSSTAGLIKNDGTIDTNAYITNSALTNYVQKSNTSGLIKNDGSIDTNTYLTQMKVGSTANYIVYTTTNGVLASKEKLGNINYLGRIGSTANKPLITTTNGTITTGSFGTSANSFCEGNDSRLSDARTPTAHTHTVSNITDFPTIPSSSSDLSDGSDLVKKSSTSGLIKNDGTIDTTVYSTFSGDYDDLTDKPTIPSKISDLTNDSDFIETSSTTGLVKNDGTIDTTQYLSSLPSHNHDVSQIIDPNGHMFIGSSEDASQGTINTLIDEGFSDVFGILSHKISTSSTVGLIKNDGSVDTNTYLTSSAISGMLTSSDIANNLTTTASGKVLDARQGKALADLIGDAITYINQ